MAAMTLTCAHQLQRRVGVAPNAALLLFLGAMLLRCAICSDVRSNCTTRPQFPNPAQLNYTFGGEYLRLQRSVTAPDKYAGLKNCARINPGNRAVCPPKFEQVVNTSYADIVASASSVQPYYDELSRFQVVYGHPRYGQEMRHNLFAQPQYGIYSGYGASAWYSNSNYYGSDTSQISWLFKGFYYFGVPGRIGLRWGNPGYPANPAHPIHNTRVAMENGHTAYIKYLSDTGRFDVGGDECTPAGSCNFETYLAPGLGRDIDRSLGVWDECVQGNLRTAYANFIASGSFKPNCRLGSSAVYSSNCGTGASAYIPAAPSIGGTATSPPGQFNIFLPFPWQLCTSAGPADCIDPSQHNCTTCTGKYNHHTRVVVSSIDEGPDDPYADPYNPWSFTVSMIYPTYVNSSGTPYYNFSAAANLTGYCQQYGISSTNCVNLNAVANNAYNSERINSQGYSPSNYGGVMSGRWDQLTARGVHLHYPPENWGASFEPTRALVSAK